MTTRTDVVDTQSREVRASSWLTMCGKCMRQSRAMIPHRIGGYPVARGACVELVDHVREIHASKQGDDSLYD